MRRKVIAGNWKMNMLPNEAIDFILKMKLFYVFHIQIYFMLYYMFKIQILK